MLGHWLPGKGIWAMENHGFLSRLKRKKQGEGKGSDGGH